MLDDGVFMYVLFQSHSCASPIQYSFQCFPNNFGTYNKSHYDRTFEKTTIIALIRLGAWHSQALLCNWSFVFPSKTERVFCFVLHYKYLNREHLVQMNWEREIIDINSVISVIDVMNAIISNITELTVKKTVIPVAIVTKELVKFIERMQKS